MRLDLFLKWCRIISRRPMAKATCDAGRVLVNGQVASAGHRLRLDDIVIVDLAHRLLKFKVRSLPKRVPSKAKSRNIIEIMEDVHKVTED